MLRRYVRTVETKISPPLMDFLALDGASAPTRVLGFTIVNVSLEIEEMST